jgi:hypothetical protein
VEGRALRARIVVTFMEVTNEIQRRFQERSIEESASPGEQADLRGKPGNRSIRLYNQLLEKAAKAGTLDRNEGETAPGIREPVEKLRLLLESKALAKEDIGQWLREKGLHSEPLGIWNQELETIVTDKDTRILKENEKLKKERRNSSRSSPGRKRL